MKRRLRSGYSTGACAAAAAKASILSLVSQKKVLNIEIKLPIGKKVSFKISECILEKNSVFCSVIKDAGDDPDVTNGIKIVAKVEFATSGFKNDGLTVCGGEGVGLVTKPGLPVKIGHSAINPVPMKMINDSVIEVLRDYKKDEADFLVTIIVPQGSEVAKRTLNSRLGIIGGISILGTTGIVEPMSLSAYRSVIDTCLNIANAQKCESIVFTPGRTTQRIAEDYLKFDKDSYVQVGDHIGYSLEAAFNKKNNNIVILSQLGKLSKIACGYFDTHAYKSKIDFIKVSLWAKELGYGDEVTNYVKNCNTMFQACDYFMNLEKKDFFKLICEKAIISVKDFFSDSKFSNFNLKLRVILVSAKGDILADVS